MRCVTGAFSVDRPVRVGVVTVTYNSAPVIRDFMASMLQQESADFVLYIIDNNSSDDTLNLLSHYSDSRIVVIPNRANLGVAEGNNIGIRAALKNECEFILLINNDTVFDSNLLTALIRGISQYECGMIVPKILYFDDPGKIWSAGGYFSGLRGSSMHFGCGQRDRGQFDLPKAVSYSPTCCMLIKREVFHRIGLMDPDYFVYFDDTDFCWRAHKAGVKLFYLSAVQLKHKVGSSTGAISNFNVRYHTRNHVYYVLKNYSRLRAFFYCSAYYFYIFGSYLCVCWCPKRYWTAQKAFWEGISVYLSRGDRIKRTLAPTGIQ